MAERCAAVRPDMAEFYLGWADEVRKRQSEQASKAAVAHE